MSPIQPHSVRNKRSGWMPQWRGAEKFTDKFEPLRSDRSEKNEWSLDLWEKELEDYSDKPDLGAKPVMVTAEKLREMSYDAINTLIGEFDAWIFKNLPNMEEIEESINNIKTLEDQQYTLLKKGGTGSKREAAYGDDVLYSDMWVEMEGQPFIMLKETGRIPKGAHVTMVYYSRMSKEVVVKYRRVFRTIVEKVSKQDIDVDLGKTKGITYYEVGAHGKDTRKSPDNVREVMYNRFDPQIKHWVDYYNKKRNPPVDADPNVLKSMIFQESKFGTHGPALKLPPYQMETTVKGKQPDYVPSRFNIVQTLDSWQHQQFMMMEDIAPDILEKYGLNQLSGTYLQMQKKELEIWNPEGTDPKTPGALVRALDEFNAANRNGKNLNAKDSKTDSGSPLFEDYDYMIRTAARWWFHFYEQTVTPETPQGDWVLATQRYNGTGPSSRIYLKQVYDRVDHYKAHPELVNGKLIVDHAKLDAFRVQLRAEEKWVYDAAGVVKFMNMVINMKKDYYEVGTLEDLILLNKEIYPEDFHPYIDITLNGSIEEITKKKEELLQKAEQYVIDHKLNTIPWHEEEQSDE